MQVFNYNFNINGNFSQSITQMAQQTDAFTQKAQGACAWCEKWAGRLAKLNLASDYVQQLSATFRNFGQANVELDSQMHDLSAVAGVTGEGLKTIENYARESAKTFGSDAGTAVQGYKLLLSQLTPELGKCPQALKAMGDAIQTTSKLMGGDGTAAAEVLTTAMNQYGVSLADPMEASRKMAEMMNTMAAAGQAGSAELPAIKAALEQCGMAAKAANVSFEETNAAIQVLDKAGKKGSEGGVALRNTLSILSQGRFLPKDTREELEKAGIDVIALGDKSKSLKERLEMLKPILSDSALFSKLFGMENANAARALVQGTDSLAHFTEAVTGTNSAVEQAGVIMESAAEKKARFRQKIEDLKISFAQLTGGVSSYIGIMAGMLVPVSQLMPLILGTGKAIKFVVTLNYASYLGRIATMARSAAVSIALMGSQTAITNGISLGFVGNVGRATLSLLRFATAGIWSGIKALGAFLLSLVTTGGASATFAGITAALNKLKGAYSSYGKEVGKAFNDAYTAEMKAGEKENAKKTAKRQGKQAATSPAGVPNVPTPSVPDVTGGTAGKTSSKKTGGGSGGSSDSGGKIRNVSIHVDKLVERLEIHTANLQESAERVKDVVAQALLSALNDTNLAME